MTSVPETVLGLTADWWNAIGAAFGALGTLAAVIVALILSVKQSREAEKKDRRRQAEKVTAWFDYNSQVEQSDQHKVYVVIHIRNASDQMIYDLIAQTVSVQGAFRSSAIGDSEERNSEFGRRVGNLPPGETITQINTGGGGMHKRFGIELAFKDAAGQLWVRQGDGTLKQVKKHPLDLYNFSRPVGWEN
jgi:hypothetical protein